MNSFSDRLKEERVRLGFNQADFALLAGVQRRAQVNYESGERNPDSLYLEKIAAVGVDVGYLITGSKTMHSDRKFTWHDVEEAGHGMLSDAGLIGAITIESKQTYDLLLGLFLRNLTKVTGVQPPETDESEGRKVG